MKRKIKNKDKDENIRKKLRVSNIDKIDTIEQSIEEVRSLKKERLKYTQLENYRRLGRNYVCRLSWPPGGQFG